MLFVEGWKEPDDSVFGFDGKREEMMTGGRWKWIVLHTTRYRIEILEHSLSESFKAGYASSAPSSSPSLPPRRKWDEENQHKILKSSN